MDSSKAASKKGKATSAPVVAEKTIDVAASAEAAPHGGVGARIVTLLPGRKAAGKDSVANVLQAEHGVNARLAFADPMRSITVSMWDALAPMVVDGVASVLEALERAGKIPKGTAASVALTVDDVTLERCLDTVAKEEQLAMSVEILDDDVVAEAGAPPPAKKARGGTGKGKGGAATAAAAAAAKPRVKTLRVPLRFSVDGEWKKASTRTLMQWLGTEVGRKELGEHVWVDRALTRLAEAEAALPNAASDLHAVITDVRFPNEHTRTRAALEARGYKVRVWRVTNPRQAEEDAAAAAAGAPPLHSSETSSAGIQADLEIVNDKSEGLEALEARVAAAVAAAEAREATLATVLPLKKKAAGKAVTGAAAAAAAAKSVLPPQKNAATATKRKRADTVTA